MPLTVKDFKEFLANKPDAMQVGIETDNGGGEVYLLRVDKLRSLVTVGFHQGGVPKEVVNV